MKKYFILFLFFTPLLSYSQQWVEIQGTGILFSNFTHVNIDSSDEHNFEYFKKGGLLLMVEKRVAFSIPSKNRWGLYSVFEKSPAAFDSIFKYAHIVFDSTDNPFFEIELDSTVTKIPYTKMIELHYRKILDGEKEVVWDISNSEYGAGEGPCFIKLTFLKKKIRNGKFNLKFLYAKDDGCLI